MKLIDLPGGPAIKASSIALVSKPYINGCWQYNISYILDGKSMIHVVSLNQKFITDEIRARSNRDSFIVCLNELL